MKMSHYRLCALTLFFVWAVMVTAAPVAVSRYALVIGSNTGGEDRVQLKYAVSDAKSFARVLTDMGGVERHHCMVITDPDKKDLMRAFKEFASIVDIRNGDSRRKEAIVYYSGHADADGIILGDEWYSYRDMRKHLQGIGADVKIAVLDACASGNLTREKGGKHRKPFLYDMATSMEGYAFLTSSASDEVSQESDAIKSSFFTHYLVSGLRGPADANRDGKVTLNEAYEFAYDATLQRTVKTRAGPQHAAYDIRLKGSGDLVLTDVRTANAQLQLDERINGRVFVHDTDGHLLVELLKKPGKPMSIGLEPGTYEVVVTDAEKTASTEAVLHSGKTTLVSVGGMAPVEKMVATARGSNTGVSEAENNYAHIPFNLSVMPAIGINSGESRSLTNASISLLGGRTNRLYGVDISSGLSLVTEEMIGTQIAAVASMAGEVRGVEISSVLNMAGGKVEGVQISGAFNTGKKCTGVQLSGGCNFTRGATYGAQIAGGLNHALGDVRVVQVSGGYNFASGKGFAVQLAGGGNIAHDDLLGVQLSGGVNYLDGGFRGAQITGGANITRGDATGVMITGGGNACNGSYAGVMFSGGANITGKATRSIQVSGLFNSNDGGVTGNMITGGANICNGEVKGTAIAGGINMTENVNGCQIAGGVNISGSVSGIQIATVNICKSMRGLQIGVVNICDTVEGIPIGVINLIRTIPPRYRVFFDEAGFIQFAVRSGAEHFYSLLSVGSSTSMRKFQWTYGTGIGGRMKAWKGYLAFESICYNVHQNRIWDDHSLMHIRNSAIYSYRISPFLKFWVGPSFNIAVAWDDDRERISYIPVTYRKIRHTWVGLWPGFIVGMEL